MSFPDGWTQGTHTYDGVTHPTYRRGSGPGVIVIHEIPGITPEVAAFGQEVVDAGLHRGHAEPVRHRRRRDDRRVDRPRPAPGLRQPGVHQAADRRDDTRRGWLRSLARDLHAELGGPGVGALGMCFTGGFALAMMVDPAVVAPVLCQPSTPFAIGPTRSRDVNLSPADLDIVKGRCAAGQQVLGVRYRQGPGRRATLRDAHHRAGRRLHPRGARGQGALHRDRPPLAGGRRRRARVLRRAAAAEVVVEEVGPTQDRGARPQSGHVGDLSRLEHMLETHQARSRRGRDLTAATCWRSPASARRRSGPRARWADLHRRSRSTRRRPSPSRVVSTRSPSPARVRRWSRSSASPSSAPSSGSRRPRRRSSSATPSSCGTASRGCGRRSRPGGCRLAGPRGRRVTIHATPALTVEAAGVRRRPGRRVAGKVGPAQLDRLVAETIKRFDLAGPTRPRIRRTATSTSTRATPPSTTRTCTTPAPCASRPSSTSPTPSTSTGPWPTAPPP